MSSANVLIAFVAISLVVSSIMIGIITYISVLERTKCEIGILRAIGASKRDVSPACSMPRPSSSALLPGLIGIGATLLLNIPINIIVHDLTGIYAINSTLPAVGGIALVLISVGLDLHRGPDPPVLPRRRPPRRGIEDRIKNVRIYGKAGGHASAPLLLYPLFKIVTASNLFPLNCQSSVKPQLCARASAFVKSCRGDGAYGYPPMAYGVARKPGAG